MNRAGAAIVFIAALCPKRAGSRVRASRAGKPQNLRACVPGLVGCALGLWCRRARAGAGLWGGRERLAAGGGKGCAAVAAVFASLLGLRFVSRHRRAPFFIPPRAVSRFFAATPKPCTCPVRVRPQPPSAPPSRPVPPFSVLGLSRALTPSPFYSPPFWGIAAITMAVCPPSAGGRVSPLRLGCPAFAASRVASVCAL